MKTLSWRKKSIPKKLSSFIDKQNPDLKLSAKITSNSANSILACKRFCPEILKEIKMCSENSNYNTASIFNYLLLSSLKLKFVKETTFACLGDITTSKNSLLGTTRQSPENTKYLFKIKGGKNNFSGIGDNIYNLTFGINGKALAISNHTIYSNKYGKGLPAGIITRFILEEAATINEALKLLDNLPHLTCSSYFISQNGKHVICETSPERNAFIYPQKYFLVLANHFINEKLVNFDIKNEIFPQNTSIQRDAHAAFFIMQNKRKITKETVRNILSSSKGGIYSDKDNIKTTYSIIYEENARHFELYKGKANGTRPKKVKL